jgi:membrane associated rhomboid family serine protease
MVMPVWDHDPFDWPEPPYVMWAIIVINLVVFYCTARLPAPDAQAVAENAGLIPMALTHGGLPGALPPSVTLITSMFLHANFMHVFGNMLFLFIFGDDIEEAIGHWRFLAFYLLSGIVAGLAFVLSDPISTVHLIGASGAVAGVMSAYLLFRPCAKVYCLLGVIPLHLRAYWVIGFWAVYQVVEVANRTNDGVAYVAHVGGLIAGAALFLVVRPKGVRLLECTETQSASPAGTTIT